MVVTQIWGTLLGCFVNYAVMTTIVTNQREVLLDPVGTNVWSTSLTGGTTKYTDLICVPGRRSNCAVP